MIRTVAVTAGYVCRAAAERSSVEHIDAANVDLKAFTGDFYRRPARPPATPMLETLLYLRHETGVWLEITSLLIPGLNDSDSDLDAMTRWVAGQLGPDVPVHFTANRRGDVPVPQHRQVAGDVDLPQAGRLHPQPGRRPVP